MAMPALRSKMSVPRCLWYQNDHSVVLRILLPGVRDYQLYVDADHLNFFAEVGDQKYCLILYFFGAIIPRRVTHKNLGREIKITIPKAHLFYQWLRFEKSTRRTPQINMDLDKVEDTYWAPKQYVEREWVDFGEYKRQRNLNILPVVPSSSDDDSSDDERFHVVQD